MHHCNTCKHQFKTTNQLNTHIGIDHVTRTHTFEFKNAIRITILNIYIPCNFCNLTEDPKHQLGNLSISCFLFRPYEPGNITDISLEQTPQPARFLAHTLRSKEPTRETNISSLISGLLLKCLVLSSRYKPQS